MMQAFDTWITCPSPNPRARLRFFCLPYAGGGAAAFRTWSNDLPAEIEVCPIQLPGRENRFQEPRFTALLPLVQELGAVMRPYLDMPCAFFGHSMGALIAFELGRYLREQLGSLPLHLFVSAHGAPQLPNPTTAIYDLPDAEFIERLRSLNGTPGEVLAHAELMQILLPLLRADFSIVGTYMYSSELPLACPITAFGGLQDESVTQDELTAWREQTSGSFALHMFTGEHFFLQSSHPAVLRVLSQELGRILAS